MSGWLACGITIATLGIGSVGGGEAVFFEPVVVESCTNLNGHVVHDGVRWSANSSLVQVDEVPLRWLADEPIAGEIIVEGDTAWFSTFDGPVLELRRYSELHCSIG